LETFGLAIKVKRILREQKGKVQTKKPAHQQKEEEKIVIEEQRMKKKHEVPRPSLPV